jgi:hypothetical protein
MSLNKSSLPALSSFKICPQMPPFIDSSSWPPPSSSSWPPIASSQWPSASLPHPPFLPLHPIPRSRTHPCCPRSPAFPYLLHQIHSRRARMAHMRLIGGSRVVS